MGRVERWVRPEEFTIAGAVVKWRRPAPGWRRSSESTASDTSSDPVGTGLIPLRRCSVKYCRIAPAGYAEKPTVSRVFRVRAGG